MRPFRILATEMASIFVFAFAALTMLTAQQANADCVACAQREDGTYYCNTINGDGADVCVIKATSCDTYYTCVCTRNCSGCPPDGCPAKMRRPTLGVERLWNATYHPGPSTRLISVADKMTDDDKVADFLKRADTGEFSDAVVYMKTDGPIAKALMGKVPANRWKSFKVGMETDPKTGKSSKTYDIETKTGYKLHIVLMD